MTILLFACASPSSEESAVDRRVDLEPPAEGYQIVTDSFLVQPYSEVDMCTVVRLEPNDTETLAWVDTMETLVSEDTHHMNVLIGQFSFLDAFLGDGAAQDAFGHEEGQYPCSELDYMESAFPIFPSQRDNQQITMPTGVAAPLIVPALYVFSHHYVNATDQTIEVNAALNLETVPADEVEHVASLVFDAIEDIDVEPGTDAVVHRTCQMERDVQVALVSTHTHEWGECTTLNDWDGESVADEPFFVNKNWEVPPILHFEPGSFDIAAGEGIHYACHYRNDTDRQLVMDGTAEGEMCVFAAVVYPATQSVAEVEAHVSSGDLSGLLGLLDEAMGPCDTQVVTETPWDEQSCEPFTQTESNTLR